MFRQSFTCSALLKSLLFAFAYGTITRYGWPSQTILLPQYRLLGCSPFARHYWGNLG